MAHHPKHYAGIGSRETPPEVKNVMTVLASILEKNGWTLRSGGADGADSAFERGIKDKNNMEIYLPNYTFNGKSCSNTGYYSGTQSPEFSRALELVDEFHPAPHKLSVFGRLLMARNAYQVLGYNLNYPSCMIICWTPDAKPVGGTSQAIRIANKHNIPIWNLANEGILTWIKNSIISRN